MSKKTQTPEPTQRRFSRRGVLLLGLQLALVGTLAWRMRQLQVVEADKYRLLAEENRINLRLIPPARGLIFDRNGEPLAINQQNYRIVIVREQARDVEDVLNRLAQIVEISPERRERVLRDVASRAAFVPVAVLEHMTWEDFARVSANAPALPGISPEVGLSRHYPHGPEFAHLVGYVGPVSDWDLSQIEDPDPLLQIPDFQIGKSGVERRHEDTLRGQAGTSRIEVNAVGRVIRELDRAEGRSGADMQLTIDYGLQAYALSRMGEESAAATVMDVHTGELLALASAPSFDPNNFVFGISQRDWDRLNSDDHRPMYNKTVSGAYPPGSTFKMIVALAAIELGLVDPEEEIFCNGSMMLGNQRFHCWRRGGHGHMNLRDSIKHSCDIYYYDIAQRIGMDRLTAFANKFGLGIRPDLPLPAVAAGLTPTRGWKAAVRGEAWQGGDTLNSGIGQGFMLASPVQLAIMTARLATGRAVEATLLRSIDGRLIQPQPAPPLEVSERGLRAVRDGMFAVSNERRGTAYSSRIADAEMILAGKTGTSQVRRISEAERRAGVFRNEDLPWNRRDHALFVGYAPYDDPKYAVSVVVEHGGSGSAAAAPIARDILMRALYGGLPPLEAYPPALREEIEEQRRSIPASSTAPPRSAGSGRA
ncbi:penicillin-binding protein 2 [Rubricella aquisinus]|uniref:Penicillin-binding protein 2 n=1 Tax=Rubricella aquisinus TaxID=2028108 RepID=A0A840X7N9_9RHOB|nr:penicillin-binding protein 2 [Rubricella aquisinus]MBB5516727.1 penicillin-binding protein 2 [Rubricella aquisinus]